MDRAVALCVAVLLLTASAALVPTNAAAATLWSLDQKTDPLTDQVVATAVGSSDEAGSSSEVILRCTGTKFEVFVDFGTYMNNAAVPVRYRFDKGIVNDASWSGSGTGTALFADEERDIARNIIRSKSFVISANDFHGQPHELLFDLTGAFGPASAVMSQCKVPVAGLDQTYPNVSPAIGLEVERWGPKTIVVGKKILQRLQFYHGAMDSDINGEFVGSVQQFYDDFLKRCSTHRVSSTECNSYLDLSVRPLAASLLYEMAPGDLKNQMGNLHMNE